MNKKPFWRRANRGFVVSMGLVAAVLIYVVVTQLMLIPARRDVRDLAETFRGYMEAASMLADDQAAALKDSQAMEQKKDQLKSDLSNIFVENSSYLDASLQYLVNTIQLQTQDFEHIRTRSDAKVLDTSCNIDQDVATYKATYSYTVSGSFMDYQTNELKDASDVAEQLNLTVTCKRVDGVWKIFRVSDASWQRDNGMIVYRGN